MGTNHLFYYRGSKDKSRTQLIDSLIILCFFQNNEYSFWLSLAKTDSLNLQRDMKANKLFLLAGFLLSGSMIPITAQNKKEKKQQREQAVREAVDAKAYKINVDRVMPMKGGSKHLTSDYSLEIRNDSVYSYLPYFGVAYNVPYGGGKGLNFSAPLSEYTSTYSKKGNAKITLKVRNEEDSYLYNITIYPNGSSNIQVTPTNRQSISFSGEMDLKKKE